MHIVRRETHTHTHTKCKMSARWRETVLEKEKLKTFKSWPSVVLWVDLKSASYTHRPSRPENSSCLSNMGWATNTRQPPLTKHSPSLNPDADTIREKQNQNKTKIQHKVVTQVQNQGQSRVAWDTAGKQSSSLTRTLHHQSQLVISIPYSGNNQTKLCEAELLLISPQLFSPHTKNVLKMLPACVNMTRQ